MVTEIYLTLNKNTPKTCDSGIIEINEYPFTIKIDYLINEDGYIIIGETKHTTKILNKKLDKLLNDGETFFLSFCGGNMSIKKCDNMCTLEFICGSSGREFTTSMEITDQYSFINKFKKCINKIDQSVNHEYFNKLRIYNF